MKRFVLAVLSLVLCSSTYAFKIQCGRNVTINEPVYENIYVLGGNILINAPIHGDLVIAGGTVYINDTIYNDVLLAGGTVHFNGLVKGDVRCAGAELHILKNVSGDLVVTGGIVSIERNATVGSLISSGSDVTIDGEVLNNALISSGKFYLNGNIAKNLDCRSGLISINGVVEGDARLSATDRISLGNSAEFKGEVRYWARNKADFKNSVKTGSPYFDEKLKVNLARWYYLGFGAFGGLLWYAATAFLMILIIQYLFSSTMRRAGNTVYNSALLSLAYGSLFCVAIPVIIVVALVTLIGLPIAAILLFGYVLLILLATIITSVVAANWLNNLGRMNLKFWRLSFSALGIFVVLKILTFTPFFGFLLMVILALISFGSILLNVNWRHRTKHISAAAV